MKLIRAVMEVYHADNAEKLAVATLSQIDYSPANRLLIESYIENCSTMADVIALEQAFRMFYDNKCFIVAKMEIA